MSHLRQVQQVAEQASAGLQATMSMFGQRAAAPQAVMPVVQTVQQPATIAVDPTTQQPVAVAPAAPAAVLVEDPDYEPCFDSEEQQAEHARAHATAARAHAMHFPPGTTSLLPPLPGEAMHSINTVYGSSSVPGGTQCSPCVGLASCLTSLLSCPGHIAATVNSAGGGYPSMPHVPRPPHLHFPAYAGTRPGHSFQTSMG